MEQRPGALATASYAAGYAPDVELGGVIATGITHFSWRVAWVLAANSDRDEVSASLPLPLSLYMLTFAEMLDPEFRLDAIISDAARPVVEQINQGCIFEFMEATKNAELSSRCPGVCGRGSGWQRSRHLVHTSVK